MRAKDQPTRSQMRTLLAMAEVEEERCGPAYLKEIAAARGITKTTVHEHLSVLEDMGYVRRTSRNKSGCMRLSKAGIAAVKKVLTPLERLRRAWKAASPEEREEFEKRRRAQ